MCLPLTGCSSPTEQREAARRESPSPADETAPACERLLCLRAVRAPGAERSGPADPRLASARERAWIVVRGDSPDHVLVQADVQANASDRDAVRARITWTGGEAVPGHPDQRRVPRTGAARHRITATLDGITETIEVWVIWATVEVRTSGQRPAEAPEFPPARVPGMFGIERDQLGPFVAADGHHSYGRVAIVATVEPAGATGVAQAGWWLRRKHRSRHSWSCRRTWDEVRRRGLRPPYTEQQTWTTTGSLSGGWLPDDSPAALQTVRGNHVYDIDAPDFPRQEPSAERQDNFVQWLEYRNMPCSDEVTWSFHAQLAAPGGPLQPSLSLEHLQLRDDPWCPTRAGGG